MKELLQKISIKLDCLEKKFNLFVISVSDSIISIGNQVTTGLSSKADKNPVQIRVGESTPILASWNGAFVIITNPNVILSIPAGLVPITFNGLVKPSANCNFSIADPKVFVNGTPALIAAKGTFVFIIDAVNNNEVYIIT